MSNNLHKKAYILVFSLIFPFLVTIFLPILIIIEFKIEIKVHYVVTLLPVTILFSNFLYNKLNLMIDKNK